MLLDKFFAVDLTYQTYKELINFWEIKTPYTSYNEALMFVNNVAMFSRLLISSYSSQIARVNEMILDLEDDQKKDEYNNKISDYMDSVPAFSKITAKVPLSPQEIKQKVKNALSHAEYNLIYDKNDPNKVLIDLEIDTEYIYGKIPFLDFDELCRFYTTISDELNLDNIVYTGTYDLLNLKTNNINLLKDAIDRIGIFRFDDKKIVDNNITLFSHYCNPMATPLTKKQKDLIFDYIRYIGLANWIQLSFEDRLTLFGRRLKFLLHSKNNFRNSASNISNTLDYCVFHGKGVISITDMYLMSFEAPNIYVGMILDLGFLTLNYIKEVLHKEQLPNINYRNINLNSIKYSPRECVKYVSKEEEERKLNVIIGELVNRKNKLSLAIQKKKEEIEKIKTASSLTDKKKNEIIKDKQPNLDSNKKKLDEVNMMLDQLKEKIDNVSGYFDTNVFFRHLRNSISHGFYAVDYSEALKKKDLTKIIFNFTDYEIDDSNRKNRKVVFEASITASKLLDLFEQLHSRVQESYDSLDLYEDKIMYFDDRRKNQNMSNEKAEEFFNSFRKKGFTLVKEKIHSK